MELLSRLFGQRPKSPAIQWAEKRVQGYSDSAVAWVELAEAYEEAGDWKNVIRACTRAHELDPTLLEAQRKMAIAYWKTGELDRAVDFFESQVESWPRHTPFWLALASIYVEQGEAEKAIKAAKTALDQDHRATVRDSLGAAYLQMKRYDEAITELEEAVAANPGDARAWCWLGEAYGRLLSPSSENDQLERALRACQRSAQLDPKNGLAWRGIAYAHMKLGNQEEAIEAATQAVMIDDAFAEVLHKVKMDEEIAPSGCQQTGVVLLTITLWGVAGWLTGIMLNSSRLGVQAALAVVVLFLGTQSLATLCVMVFTGAVVGNLLTFFGALLLMLSGGAFLLKSAVSVSGFWSIGLPGIGVLLLAVAAGAVHSGIRAIRADPAYYGAAVLPRPLQGSLGEPDPLSWPLVVWSVVGSLLNDRLRGVLLMPLAIWAWTRWLVPHLGIDASPVTAAFIVSAVFYGILFLARIRSPRHGYLTRGEQRLDEARSEWARFDQAPQDRQEIEREAVIERANGLRRAAAADFWAAVESRPGDVVAHNDELRSEALRGLSETLIFLERYEDARTYAEEAIRISKNAGSYLWLGASLLELGDFDGALEALGKGLELCKNDKDKEVLQGWIEGVEEEMKSAESSSDSVDVEADQGATS